nr:hypothetical protein [Tanacetum cinerariifolium]
MATMAKNVIATGSETHPRCSKKACMIVGKPRLFSISEAKRGEISNDSIDNGPYQFKSEITVKDTYGVTNICLDIYTLNDQYQTAKEIWDRVKELMEGTTMTKQERQRMLYDEFNRFTSEPGESIHSYYLRFTKLINDIKMMPMTMSHMQINTKFVNHLQPEWSRFITTAKQARVLHSVTFDQLYSFLKHNEKDAQEVQEMRQRFSKPLALLAKTYNPPPLYNSHQTQFQAPPVRDFEWFKEKMLLAQAQEARVVLNDEQQDFLADSLEETDDCDDLQLQASTKFKADHVDAYDLDCNDEAIANAIFMENLSHVGSLNDYMV